MIAINICQECGLAFSYETSSTAGKYCSKECYYLNLSQHPPNPHINCNKCETPLNLKAVYTDVRGTVRCRRCGVQLRKRMLKHLLPTCSQHLVATDIKT